MVHGYIKFQIPASSGSTAFWIGNGVCMGGTRAIIDLAMVGYNNWAGTWPVESNWLIMTGRHLADGGVF